MDDDTSKVRYSPEHYALLRKIDKLESRLARIEERDAEQASKERQSMHYRTLFGSGPDKLGLVQRVEKLWDFRAAALRLLWSTVTALVLGAGGLLVNILMRAGSDG